MNTFRLFRCALACWLILPASLAVAAEPAEAFLDALRNRGYYDMALEYLDRAQSDPLSPVGFREVIPLERGLTLVDSARREADFDVRGELLNKAQEAVQQFVSMHVNSTRRREKSSVLRPCKQPLSAVKKALPKLPDFTYFCPR